MKVFFWRLVVLFICLWVFRSLLTVPSPYDFLAALFYELLVRIRVEISAIHKIFAKAQIILAMSPDTKKEFEA